MIYACCDERRKAAVLGNPALNGIDYLEVLDQDAIPLASPRQQTLLLHCLRNVPAALTPANVLIEGGERVTGITAAWIAPALPAPPLSSPAEAGYFAALPDAARVLVIRTSVAGDFSPYVLRLVDDATAAADLFSATQAIAGFDPQLSEVRFSFKVECGPDFDRKPADAPCPDDLPEPPAIDYLAKDYGALRTVLLDRLGQLLPGWQGDTEADIGVMLAEVLAFVGDHRSYKQDAVITEAYLPTARSRISLRRHALLVDYTVNEGCNARAWVALAVSMPVFMDRTLTRFYTWAPGMPASLAPGSGNERDALDAGVIVFEPMQDASLRPEHNVFHFYTWGDSDCCLPRGATSATLLGSFPDLAPGDVLIFQEMMGPQTGVAADADLRHRRAVRLTAVATQTSRGAPLVDPLIELGTGQPITSALQRPTPVTEIRWADDDALPFAVCVSSRFTNADGLGVSLTDVSMAFGNVVLTDQGVTMPQLALPVVPAPALYYPDTANDRCDRPPRTPFPVRFRPSLPDAPLTRAVPLPLAGSPVTPVPVALPSSGHASLFDANGYVALMVTPENVPGWPQYFIVLTESNAANPAEFDLSILFSPQGGPTGVTGQVTLERFAGLTLTAGAPNNAVTQINSLSRLIRVPNGYAPPAVTPSPLTLTQTQLTPGAPVSLPDSGGAPFLAVEPVDAFAWPPLFAVLAQDDLTQPDTFNLLVLFAPPTGGVGVNVSVVIERFTDIAPGNVAATFAAPSDLISVLAFDDEPNPALSAASLMRYDGADALPFIGLTDVFEGASSAWNALGDLLESSPEDRAFVVETDSDGTATLRFGDGTNGYFPPSGSAFSARYRIGNGTAGNVGADTLTWFSADPRVLASTNPLVAAGGVDPESAEQIRRRAPQAFMTQERCVTMDDYAEKTRAYPGIEDAAATLRWTGSWYTVFITAQPDCSGPLTDTTRRGIERWLERFRLAGQDLEIRPPDYLSLDIVLTVCVDPSYFQRDVEQALLQVLGTDGRTALFAPGRLRLGQTVYLSPIYAAARTVAGVTSVAASMFQPQGAPTSTWLERGEITVGPFQAARMDNDPSLPDHGRLTLVMQGGK